jgi:glycine/D-amino acid oxidase-like deaminating enzyme
MKPSTINRKTDTLVIGAGIVGISTAYYLKLAAPDLPVTLVDMGRPMELTSAHSGENYRNWWPHPVMERFTNHSIDLLEDIARQSNNRINLTRRGYVLATRKTDIDDLLKELLAGYADDAENTIRIHDTSGSGAYEPPLDNAWQGAPSGVDVMRNDTLIRQHFPCYDPEIKTLVHIRRGGSISGQQMGQFMLEQFRRLGGQSLQAQVVAIDKAHDFVVSTENTAVTLQAARIVNAAGPFLNRIAGMLDIELPISNVLQQKIAFEDTSGAIARRMPFSIDLDGQYMDWSEEERQLLAEDPDLARLTEQMPGSIHCRPDGGDSGTWIKLGWAFNEVPSAACVEPVLNDNFPEIVLRGAARLNPSLKTYYARLPRNMAHYGGFYTMTDENWPLIGPMGVDGTFVVGAMSGFGTMAACAAGELCAKQLLGAEAPDYANALSLERYQNQSLMTELLAQNSRGLL